MADSFRWRLSGTRDRLLEDLENCTGENTKAKALEKACCVYLQLIGGNLVKPGPGLLVELLTAADEQGRLSASEIAEILATDEIPIEFEPATWTVGITDSE